MQFSVILSMKATNASVDQHAASMVSFYDVERAGMQCCSAAHFHNCEWLTF